VRGKRGTGTDLQAEKSPKTAPHIPSKLLRLPSSRKTVPLAYEFEEQGASLAQARQKSIHPLARELTFTLYSCVVVVDVFDVEPVRYDARNGKFLFAVLEYP
jgi:hypothetical protein